MATAPARVFRINPERKHSFELLLLFLGLAPTVAIAIFAYRYEVLWKFLADRSYLTLVFVMPFLGLGMVWINSRILAGARLTLDGQGLALTYREKPFFGLAPAPEEHCRWDDIGKVRVIAGLRVVQIRRKRTMARPMVLKITDWVEEVPGVADYSGRSSVPMRETALWKALEEAGLFSEQPTQGSTDALDFDLLGHPGTRFALIAMAGLFGYAALDAFLRKEAWADWGLPYLLPHVIAGIFAAAAAAFALLASRHPNPVPREVAIPLALLVGVSGGGASWSLLIRVNEWFGGPLEERAYVRNEACNTLIPVEPGLPAIEYTAMAKDYWCRFPIEQQHPVPIRKGLGGLYQVDLTRYTEAIRKFRRSEGSLRREGR